MSAVDWSALYRLGATVRPIVDPPPLAGRLSAFRAPLSGTIEALVRELRELEAERIVLMLDITERNIRADGLPRADARLDGPPVALSFESVHGPLRYATGEYRDWRDNLRAIALSMEALRAVDRYGVSKRGEQYQGWRAIPASTDAADRVTDAIEAAHVLHRYAEDDDADFSVALRRAIRATHPDQNPDKDGSEFRAVMRAKELLGL